MPLGKEVGLGQGHIVLDGDPVGTHRRPQQPLPTFRRMSIVAKRSPISATGEFLLNYWSVSWRLCWLLLYCVNVFIVKLRHTGYGCNLCGQFVGCILYADDFIILSASVRGLQNMLHCCFEVSYDLCITFNCAKSSCFAIGKRNKLRISDMNLGPKSIERCDSFKYLGVIFRAMDRN